MIYSATTAINTQVTGSGFSPGESVYFQSTPGDAYGAALINPDGTFSGTLSAATVSADTPAVLTFKLTAGE